MYKWNGFVVYFRLVVPLYVFAFVLFSLNSTYWPRRQSAVRHWSASSEETAIPTDGQTTINVMLCAE